MQTIVQRFWGFEKLLGPVLVKILYYLGLAAIGVGVALSVLTGVLVLVSNPIRGLILIVIAPVIGAVALVWWRFICEAFILAFETYERLGEIRDRLPLPGAKSEPPMF